MKHQSLYFFVLFEFAINEVLLIDAVDFVLSKLVDEENFTRLGLFLHYWVFLADAIQFFAINYFKNIFVGKYV